MVDKSDAQLADIKKTLEGKQQIAAAAAKARADADAERAKKTEALKASEQEVTSATAAIAQAQKSSEAKKEALRKLDEDTQKLKKMMEDQFRQIEMRRKELESGASSPDASLLPSFTTPPPIVPRKSFKERSDPRRHRAFLRLLPCRCLPHLPLPPRN